MTNQLYNQLVNRETKLSLIGLGYGSVKRREKIWDMKV